jgi:hypothetical protein
LPVAPGRDILARVNVRRLWAASGALAVVLFGCGLLFGDLLGSSNYPPLNAPYARLETYFLDNGSEVRALAFFHLLSALALLCFVAYLHDRLRDAEQPRGRLPAIALAGGITAAGFLLLSALIYRALAEPAVVREPALAHALVVISYLAGGPAIAVPLALPIAAGATVALRRVLLPRWTAWLGIAAAAASLLSATTLLGPMNNSSITYAVLLLAAVLGFLWTFVASVLLAAAH